MALHKWFVRGLVFTTVAGAVLGTLAYQHWTNPGAVRDAVLDKTIAMFPGAAVTLNSASLRILGGIQVHELRLASGDDPDSEIAHIPSAILYHNKEKILDGRLSFRKVELYRPRLRVLRDKDGKWNVQGLTAAGKPGQAVPTIVVHEATVHFEDYSRDEAAPFKLELTHANLTLINDPRDVVTISGAAQSDLLGKIVVSGAWQRQANELALSIKTLGTKLNETLLDRCACFCPTSKLQGLQLSGQAQVHVQLALRPGAEPACTLNAHLQVAKTAVRHPELPLPLEIDSASVRFDGAELRVESLQGRAGTANISVQGAGRLPCLDQHFDASIQVERFQVDERLTAQLPASLRPIMRIYEPRGPVSMFIDVARRGGQWTLLADGQPSRITVRPEGLSACFERFRYPVHKVTGVVHCVLPQKRFQADLVADANGRPVSIKGHWQEDGPRIDMQYDVVATDAAIDADLIAALPQPIQATVKSFHVAGKFDVHAHIRRYPTDDKFHSEYHIRLKNGAIAWDEFPYLLTNVGGLIDVYPNANSWQFRDFQGTHGPGRVAIYARSAEPDHRHAKPGVFVEITGKDLPLDADLQRALRTMPPLAKAWAMFQPSGLLNFTAAIDHRGKETKDLEARVDVKGPSLRPVFFPYALNEFAGHFHLHDERLELRRLSATHDQARWYLEKGSVELHASGAAYADLPELQAEHLVLDPDLIAALPPRMWDCVESLRCNDPLRLKTRLIVSHPAAENAPSDVYWDGQIWLDNAALTVGLDLTHVSGTVACIGRHDGRQLKGLTGNLMLERAAALQQPFRKVQGKFHIKETAPELLLLDLNAPIFGGDVAGQVSLDFSDQPKYELNLTASQIDLQEFGRHNLANNKLAGVVVARLYLTGIGNDPNTLDGNGTLDIPNGKLYDLPFLLDLIKFLGLRWPDRTLFEELHCQYSIRGRRATIRHLDLFGNAVSFNGKGAINLDGTDLHLDLYPSWARIEQLLPPAARSVPPALSKNLLTVEARGNITGNSKDVRFTKKPVPLIVDPLLGMRDRFMGTPGVEPRQPVSVMSPPTLSRAQ